MRTVTVAELQSVGIDDLSLMGFINYMSVLLLIPLWAYNYIANGETLICIDGASVVKGVDHIDLEARSGCIAYGFK